MTINIHLTGSALNVTGPLPVLADGTVKKAKFRLFPDADWDGLAIKVVFRRVYAVGVEKRTVVIGDVAAEYEIPHEVLHDGWLYIGAVGVADDGEVRLTTAQMERPLKVSASEDVEADPSGSITPEVADQILALVGAMSKLNTADKSSLVAAINEVLSKITAGGVTSVAGKTGAVTLAAEDIAAQIDGTEAKTVADALALLVDTLNRLDAADVAARIDGTEVESVADALVELVRRINACVTGFSFAHNANGGYTATWTENGASKKASIYGGVGMAKVGTILRIDSDAFLPVFAKAALDGFHEYPVMIGDLIGYSGADVTQTFHVGVTTGDEKDIVVNVAHGEVFRVRAVSNYGTDDEYYNVERTGLVLPDIGVTDRREEWLAWLLEEDGQTSDADVAISEVFRFLRTLPDGLHYLDNPGCWGKFWSVNQAGLDGKTKCVVLAPPDIYIITADGGALKMTSTGTLEKYSNNGETLVKSVDLINAVPPKTTAEDALKIWAVGADGTPAWTEVKNVMEVAV